MDVNRLRGEIVAEYKTQTAFATVIGWHKNKVSKMLCGEYKPNTDEVAAIVDVLKLDERRYCAIFLPKISPNGDSTALGIKADQDKMSKATTGRDSA